MVFKGFNIVLPEYTVITPQTGETFSVRSLTVAEVNQLRTSLITPSKAHSLLNNILWNCIVGKPNHIKTEDDFKRMTTTVDREALLYGLYTTTFGEDRDFHVVCSSCGKDQMIKIVLSRIFSMNAYPHSKNIIETYKVAKALGEADADPEIEESIRKQEAIRESAVKIDDTSKEPSAINKEDEDDGISIGTKTNRVEGPKQPNTPREIAEARVEKPKDDSVLTKRLVLELPISKIVAIIRQPTIYDEESLLSELAFATKKQGDMVNETMVIERFEQYEEGNKVPSVVVTKRDDILYGYQSLPPRDKIKIFEEYRDKLGQYCIELKTNFECQSCGTDNDLEVNIAVQFFRLVGIS